MLTGQLAYRNCPTTNPHRTLYIYKKGFDLYTLPRLSFPLYTTFWITLAACLC